MHNILEVIRRLSAEEEKKWAQIRKDFNEFMSDYQGNAHISVESALFEWEQAHDDVTHQHAQQRSCIVDTDFFLQALERRRIAHQIWRGLQWRKTIHGIQ